MKKFLLMCFSFGIAISVWAQDRVITGKVTSSDDGSALPGVNVVLKGTTSGTVTDATGDFKISVPAPGGVLIFSFIGMRTSEEEIGVRSVIDLQMKADIKQLQEVVVNAIGESRPKDKLGIASSTITGNSVAQSGEAGVINGLAGKAAGLNITRSGGDPGAGSYIQLRGQSTITGDLQPLIVIDGMPMFNSTIMMNSVAGTQQQSRLNDLNPADIASIEVIKSAAGAALWGSRAANGVIVITTKKGKNTQGKLSVSYTGTVSFDKVNKMPDLQTT
ncbi:MAG: carboxypeptidase-like regulatory domain-containing protein, partial [Bacteroidetes bacterium]|nr:carboxypeptidase-like regulatory domain-containing protein [Bacteroidota bacterium]